MLARTLSLLLVGASATFCFASGSFNFKGTFVEGCSCKDACAYELNGSNPGCKAAGFYAFDSGSYGGKSLAGTKVAFVVGAEGWFRLYVDGPNAQRRETVTRFMKAALKDFGKAEAVRHLPITVEGFKGHYQARVAKGSVLNLQTSREESVPKAYGKLYNKTLHPTIFHTSTLTCTFKDGKRSLQFGGTNGFYHSKLNVRGKL